MKPRPRPTEEPAVEWMSRHAPTAALLQLGRGDDPRRLIEDAATLRRWITDMGPA